MIGSCSVINDFSYRDALPESSIPTFQWYNGSHKFGLWGPPAATYPPAQPCTGMTSDQILEWKRQRVVAAARKYIGLSYRHHHVPGWDDRGVSIDGEVISDSGKGLDCSNATSWFYNYSLGIKFTSDIKKQSETVGVQLPKNSTLLPGDLLFFMREDFSEISHVGIYTGNGQMIDSRGSLGGITEHSITSGSWYRTHMAYARRVLS